MRLLHTLLLASFASAALTPSSGGAQAGGNRQSPKLPAPSINFPAAGDTADVYRAALDLVYIDGKEKPKVIVAHAEVGPAISGPVLRPRAGERWGHQSAIDTSTILAFASLPFEGLPRFRQFGYTIPIIFLTEKERMAMREAGFAYDRAHPPAPNRDRVDPTFGELLRRYPGAWGIVAFTDVAFSSARTESLLGIYTYCGSQCRSVEVVFFKKMRGKWTPIERVPGRVEHYPEASLRYRGPAVKDSTQSDLLVAGTGAPMRSDAQDAPAIYRAVLDSLYSFFGEAPRKVVISGQHTRVKKLESTQIRGLDPATLAAYNTLPLEQRHQRTFAMRLRTEILSVEERQRLEYEDRGQPFWLAFRRLYPGAWGYVEVSPVGYNPGHTQALVYTMHRCGPGCQNGATWFLTRAGEKWSIRKILPQDEELRGGLDSLRYLGTGASPKMYRPRRARGVFTNAATGEPLPNLEVIVTHKGVEKKITTNSQGRYSLTNLPLNEGTSLSVECPVPGRTERVAGADLWGAPGTDTIANVALDYRMCRRLNRDHPLIAVRVTPSKTAFHSVSAAAAEVYRAILDMIYPPATPIKGPILMEAFTEDWCRGCFGIEAEVPRLIREGVVDTSTERSFVQAHRDTVSVPAFSYRHKIRLLPIEDKWVRGGGRGGYDWELMKDAYPGSNAVISFSAVGFNSRGDEALVEVRVDSVNKEGGETLLLRKTDGNWRLAVRHLNRGSTIGEWSVGKCEPTVAKGEPVGIPEVKKIFGEFYITRVGTTRDVRGETRTIRVAIDSLTPNPKYGGALVGNVRMLGATGPNDPRHEGELWVDKEFGQIIFNEKPTSADDGHWMADHFNIHSTDGTNFFGGWWYGNEEDMTYPPQGYFCARPAN